MNNNLRKNLGILSSFYTIINMYFPHLQLVDMGFTREHVLEALSHTNSVEGATEWLLTHSVSNEDDELLRAISMSLEGAGDEEEADDEGDEQSAAAEVCVLYTSNTIN